MHIHKSIQVNDVVCFYLFSYTITDAHHWQNTDIWNKVQIYQK